ncbi:hypothetical protein K5I29_00980 [Flavobacterium agricola]|uniref:DUF3299 domain-containing protein n=1 Tax=Flavobacterium agricola TaxID=2870839 RepID=A0ABY6M2B2_9FLAO|nr:hypothetical protein [Flavobacterium agricola]UYW01540.1 hypothetical protein K5I29_00980 [Flavobacterium agricola]
MLKRRIILGLGLAAIIGANCFLPQSESALPVQKAGFITTEIVQNNPTELNWNILGDIKYVNRKDPRYGEISFPVVNAKLKVLQGKKITMTGFIVPIDNKSYALSKNVFASCFFCGQAGPETIMGIVFKGETPKLKTDQYVTLEGTFRYNETDVDDWIYHIENAVIIKGAK